MELPLRVLFGNLLMIFGVGLASAEEFEGVKYGFEEGSGVITAERLGAYRLRLGFEPSSGSQRVLRVDLPESGPKTWPIADVRVVDMDGDPLAVRRPGIEWGKLTIPLASGIGGIVVEALEPEGGWPVRTSARDRLIEDQASGASVRISAWPGGRDAALSFRFDDSGPSHLDLVDPLLREHGFRGTFMVNPGPDEPGSRRRSAFQERLDDWKALAGRGDHELANHTAHHRGAGSDEEMDAEIGLAAEIIRQVAPHQRGIMALNLGGGTTWTTTQTLRYYLEKHRQFDISGSLGMDDVYGGRIEAFRRHLETHLERGLWARVHYHGIGEGEGASEANFRAALAIAAEHWDRIWNAGMAEIHAYQTARDGARLTLLESGVEGMEFRVETSTNPHLYKVPLEIEGRFPAERQFVKVETSEGDEIASSMVSKENTRILRFEIPPVTASYRLAYRP